MAEYTTERGLHMAYSFELLTDDFSAAHVRDTLQTLESAMPHGWPCWSISNHDVRRVISRWGGERRNPELAGLFTALLCSLRGSARLYPGEDLGLMSEERGVGKGCGRR